MNSIKSSAKKVIVMPNKTQEIKPHDFEKAKNALKKFSKGIPLSTDLPTVVTEGGLFGWFDHKVTGSELNNVTDKVQDLLIATNKQLIQVINEFGQVYQTFEALDKDYIQGLIAGYKSAQAASNQATKAAEKAFEAAEKAKRNTSDIESLIKSQNSIIDKLVEFKKRIENIPHIDEVSTMWKDTQDFKNKIQSIRDGIHQSETYAREATKLILAQEMIVNNLVKFQEEFEAIPHIRDLKIVWDDVHGLKDQILTMSDAIADNQATTNGRFAEQDQQIAKQNDELVLLIDKNRVDLSEKLIDASKAQTEENREFTIHFETFQNDMRVNEIAVDERFVVQNSQLLKKIKIAYVAAGTFGTITVIHIVLAMLGIV